MPGVHKNKTIAFRPEEWERIIIEEKVALSGMNKKDFIAKSCIYSNICVVGSKVNIKKILETYLTKAKRCDRINTDINPQEPRIVFNIYN